MRRKFLSCLAMLFSLCTIVGCGNNSNNGNTITDSSDPSAPNLEGVTIRLLTEDTWVAGFSLSDILPRFKQIERRTGCKIIWNTIPGGSDYNSVVQTRIAGGGEECPDIVLTETSLSTLSEFIKQGLVYNYKEAFDVCPNIKLL